MATTIQTVPGGTSGDDTITTNLLKDFFVDSLAGDDEITIEETASAYEIQARAGEDLITANGDATAAKMRVRAMLLVHAIAAHAKPKTADSYANITGVPLWGQQHYVNGYRCADGTIIPRARVNDDACDCADGGDEPGTAADDRAPLRKRAEGAHLGALDGLPRKVGEAGVGAARRRATFS